MFESPVRCRRKRFLFFYALFSIDLVSGVHVFYSFVYTYLVEYIYRQQTRVFNYIRGYTTATIIV